MFFRRLNSGSLTAFLCENVFNNRVKYGTSVKNVLISSFFVVKFAHDGKAY